MASLVTGVKSLWCLLLPLGIFAVDLVGYGEQCKENGLLLQRRVISRWLIACVRGCLKGQILSVWQCNNRKLSFLCLPVLFFKKRF